MATPPVGRRKGSAIRAWLTVSDSGGSELREVGKHAIMRRTGLPARDLRVLDPMLSYPSTILGRERAIVVNLDHIKAIVTATEVLLPNSRDPVVAPFVHDLCSRVGPPTSSQAIEGIHVDGKSTVKDVSCLDSPSNPNPLANQNQVAEEHHELMIQNVREGSSPLPITSSPKDGGAKLLPFEFRALEVCLESACRSLESETLTLETEAYPALDELTSKISTLKLERVRQIKSRLVAVSGRVQKVRDELEHLLDDDMDMAEMYLTQKLVNQPIGGTSFKVESDDDVFVTEEEREDQFENDSERSIRTSNAFKPNIEELEMLLEAYFVQIDGILNKLSTLKEYVDDTEDYINIMLDEKQNQLLQMGVMLSTATLVFNAGIAVVGLFGMNITIDLFKDNADPSNFWKTTFYTVGACVLIFVIAIGWGKKSGLLRL